MKEKIFYFIFFVSMLFIFRIIPHPSNFSPIIASCIMCPFIVNHRLNGIAIPLIAVFLSDIILGFHVYQFVVYTTLLTIGLITPITKGYFKYIFMMFAASFWFFIVTNFAVWIIWDYYPKTFEGLTNCYFLAIPFFKNTVLSTVMFTGLLMISSNRLRKINERFNSVFYKEKIV